ncbi:MAG: ABC transporter substrate-binding protein [Sphaerochaeta sp.]|uniref:ABC transporter substrate-binding protein n=1 Tax=Sphaerochaeta sp. TaxID=1972642 RepID=UPI003D0CCBB7
MKRILLFTVAALLAGNGLFAQARVESNEAIQPVVITWWHSNSGMAGKAADALVEGFNATIGTQKNIRVEAVYQGKANDVLTKAKGIWQSSVNTDLPDLVQLDAQAVLDIRDIPQLIPMETLAVNDGYDLSQILEAARLSVTYKQKMIGMPFNSSTIMLYYNKTAFEEAGIKTPPKTLTELADTAKALVKQDANHKVTRYGFANVPTTYELIVWLGQQHGLSYITDEENGHTGIPTKVLFDENGTMVTFLKQWKQLYASGAVENLTSDLNGAFASGRVAMIVASTSNLTTILNLVGDRFEVGVANFPMVNAEATGGVNVGGGALYALDNGSQHSEAAWQFVKYATQAEQQLAWHIATGYFPVNTGTYDLPSFQEHMKNNPLYGVAIEQLMQSNPKLQGLWIPSSYQIYYAFQSGILKMLSEDKSPEETSKALAAEIDGYLADYLRMQ